MDRTIEWAGLDVVAELLGVTDIEMLIRRLVAIRAHVNKPRD